MNPLGVALALLPALINAVLAIVVVRTLPRDRTTQVFLWFVVALVVWQLFDAGVRAVHTAEAAATWRATFRLGQCLAIPASVHLALRLTERDAVADHSLTMMALYLPSLAFLSWYEAGFVSETLVQRSTWGWIATLDTSPYWVVMSSWLSLLALTTPLLLVSHLVRIRHRSTEHVDAIRLVTFGISVPVVAGIISEVLLPLVGIQQIPLTSTTMSVFSAAAFVALTRYDLFRLEQFDVAASAMVNVTDPVLIASPRGRVLYANQAAHSVRPIPDAMPLEDLLPPDGTRAFFDGPWARCLEGEPVRALELELLRTDGTRLPVIASLAPVQVGPGVRGCVLVAHDVTPLRRAMEAVQETSRAKSHFLANMSHELRTPLNAIIGYAELLGEDSDDPDASEDLRRIESSGRYLLGLINDVLDISRIESGKLRMALQEHPPGPVVDKLLPDIRQLCRTRGNRFDVVQDPVESVVMDPMRLRQVLLNLVSNAAKFTQDGLVSVSLRQEGEQVRIDVGDTGIGMDEGQIARLFEPFSQVHTQDHVSYGGTGLGLAISRRLCRAMHGELTVRSDPGVGSIFTVWLTPWRLRPSDPDWDALALASSPPSLYLTPDPIPRGEEHEKEGTPT